MFSSIFFYYLKRRKISVKRRVPSVCFYLFSIMCPFSHFYNIINHLKVCKTKESDLNKIK